MKIGVVYQSTYPPVKGASGADRRIRDLTRGLCQNGNHVEMLIPANRNSGIANKDNKDYQITYLSNGRFHKIPFIGRFGFWNTLQTYLLKENFDVVLLYNTTPESAFYPKHLRQKGIKVIYEICDLHSSFGINLKNLLLKYGEQKLPTITDFNIVISEFLKNKVQKLAPKTPLIKIPILVDSDMFTTSNSAASAFKNKYKISSNKFIITYVGGHWKHEGVRYLVEAFSKLIKKYNHLHLVIAGKLANTEAHDDIATLVQELKVADKTTLTGWIGTEDVIGLFSCSDILTVPQTNHTFSQAGLPTKLAEYASMAKAIVATSVGDVPEYFTNGHNAMLCQASNSESLAKSLESVIVDDNLKHQLGQNAKKTAQEHFDYQVCGKKILAALAKL